MLLAGSTRELRQPVQSGDSPEGKTPPPWGVLCSQRGVDQLWAERVREDLESALQGKPGGWGRGSGEATPAFPAAATCFGRLSQTGRLSLAMERFGTV